MPTNFYRYFDELEGKALIDQIHKEEPEVPIVSHSQIGSWNHCEFQWYMSYVEGWTEIEKKSYLILGSLGHEALAVYYRSLQAGLPVHEARELVQTKLAMQFNEWAFKGDSYLPALGTMSWLVMKYIDEWAPFQDRDITKIHGVEEHFIIALLTPKGRKYYLQGYIDLRVEVRGIQWIWDHKFPSQFWYPIEVRMDTQQPYYAAAYTYGIHEQVNGTVINQLKTYDYKNKENVPADKVFQREMNFHTNETLRNTLIEVGMAVDSMVEFRESGKRPRRQMSRACSRCWFQDPCYHGLQGHNMQQLLEVSFRKKEDYKSEGELDGEDFNVFL